MVIQTVLIRDEKATDFAVISAVTIAAFETMEVSNHTEQFIIAAKLFVFISHIASIAEIKDPEKAV